MVGDARSFNRRYATTNNRRGRRPNRGLKTRGYLQSSLRDEIAALCSADRGLKPTSTLIASLRDEWELSTTGTKATIPPVPVSLKQTQSCAGHSQRACYLGHDGISQHSGRAMGRQRQGSGLQQYGTQMPSQGGQVRQGIGLQQYGTQIPSQGGQVRQGIGFGQ
jgi:hypothetical protein